MRIEINPTWFLEILITAIKYWKEQQNEDKQREILKVYSTIYDKWQQQEKKHR